MRPQVGGVSANLDTLRDAFTALTAPTETLAQGLNELAESLPLNFNDYWDAGHHVSDGPVDLIDIFSGCGGISAGFRAINGIAPTFRHVLAVDNDPVANATYEKNIGLKPVAADAHELAVDPQRMRDLLSQSRRRPEAPLVLIGCAPCQGFSSHRNGATDDRNGLFVDFARIAVRLEPDFIVIENVPELCTDQHWGRVSQARDIFKAAGYQTHLSVHNFAEFGLPQERYRALMIGSRQLFRAPTGFLERNSFRTVRDSISSLPPVDPGRVDPKDPMHFSAGHKKTTVDMIKTVPKDGGRRAFDAGPPSLIALHARQGKPAYEDVYGRLYWDRPAITITGSSRNPASGRFVHPEQDRGLTVREGALLQGFPSSFEFTGGLDASFRQIGNAVPPLVAAYVGLTLISDLLDPPPDGPGEGVESPLARSFARLIPSLKNKSSITSSEAPSPLVDTRWS
jgi:DNA (cytosine-5)-methyltransferase 1